MKNLKTVVLFLWVSLFACQVGANLLVNPGFESGTTAWFEWGTGTYSTSIETSNSHSGAQCLLVSTGLGDSGLRYQRVSGVENLIYTAKVWAKISAGSNVAALKLEFHSDPSTKIIDYVLPISATGTWTEYQISNLSPSGTTLVTASCVASNNSDILFDDVSITAQGLIRGDFNNDYNVDMADFRILASRWLDICAVDQWCDGTDLDRSEAVDMGDFAVFSGTYPKRLPDILGVTHVDGKYYFGTEDFLNEGADRLLSLGTRVIKVWFTDIPGKYPWNSTWPTMNSLLAQAQSPYFAELFSKPFTTFILEAHTTVSNFGDGMTAQETLDEQQEFYDLTTYLLNTYQDTGKTFVLQHWEGDWLIRGNYDDTIDPTPTAIQGMIDWLNARQAGVNQAKAEFTGAGVKVYHAAEVNKVVNSMTGGNINVINYVIPYTNVDMVSYSSYDAIYNVYNPGLLKDALDFIALNTPDSPDFGDKNVFLGEYGFAENLWSAADYQKGIANATMTALSWGCQYLVYWQLYCNELQPGATAPVTSNSDVNGFWLIRPDGTYSWSWDYLYGLLNPSP